MSGWLDLIGIGIDVAQSHQIYKAREQLAQIQAGAQEDAMRKMVLELMRNFVFEIAQDIKALEEKMQVAPQQVYVVARALEWRLQDSGISPEIFSEFFLPYINIQKVGFKPEKDLNRQVLFQGILEPV